MIRRDHAGRGLLSLGVNCGCPRPRCASVRKGLAKAATIGQSAKGLRSVFKSRTSRVLRTLGIIREKLMDKAPGSWIGRWVFGRSVSYDRLAGELGLRFRDSVWSDLKD